MKLALRSFLKPIQRIACRLSMTWNQRQLKREVDLLYQILYQCTHDLDEPLQICAKQTEEAFSSQWKNLKSGQALLTDPWFRKNVTRILTEEEILIRPEWFQGKKVLDAGCGNGRWSYGLAKLGAHVTAVDINQSALDETKKVLSEFDQPSNFYQSPLEKLTNLLSENSFDLVFSWGVLHHCNSFTKAFSELCRLVKPDGMIYFYLYGRESYSLSDDLELFKERLHYNSLSSWEEKVQFLLRKAKGNEEIVHNLHDFYAPLINRRLEFVQVKQLLEKAGFESVERTIDHTELFVRAYKKGTAENFKTWELAKRQPPYWFAKY